MIIWLIVSLGSAVAFGYAAGEFWREYREHRSAAALLMCVVSLVVAVVLFAITALLARSL